MWLSKVLLMKVALSVLALNWCLQIPPLGGPVVAIPEWAQQAEHLGLLGSLMFACAILWKAFKQKDEALVKMSEVVTKALEQAATSNAELRAIIKESVESKQALRESIELLRVGINQLPCTEPDRRGRIT